MKTQDVRSYVVGERRRLVNYARALTRNRPALDAEDIVHDVLIKVLERTDMTTPENLAAYVFRAIKNRVIDSIRTHKHTVSLDDEAGGSLADVLRDEKGDVVELLQTDDGRTQLFKALDTLSNIERDVIIHHEFEGVSFKQMSDMWAMPVNTLLSHKRRALSKLRTHIANS